MWYKKTLIISSRRSVVIYCKSIYLQKIRSRVSFVNVVIFPSSSHKPMIHVSSSTFNHRKHYRYLLVDWLNLFHPTEIHTTKWLDARHSWQKVYCQNINKINGRKTYEKTFGSNCINKIDTFICLTDGQFTASTHLSYHYIEFGKKILLYTIPVQNMEISVFSAVCQLISKKIYFIILL